MASGLVVMRSNADMLADEAKKALDAIEQEKRARGDLESDLAAYVKRKWEIAKQHKQSVEDRILDNIRQIEGRYSAKKEADILAQGLPLIYMRITTVKCRAAKSWIRDVLMPAGDKPWSLNPTPVPSLDKNTENLIYQKVVSDAIQFMQMTGQEITQDDVNQKTSDILKDFRHELEKIANEKTERMSELIEDQLVEGGWNAEFDDVISDIVDFPAAILKAPVIRKQKKLTWNGEQPVVSDSFAPKVERIDPLNFYPLPNVVDIDDGDVIEYHEWTKTDLYNLIGASGFNEDNIRAAIRDYENGYNDFSRDALRSERARIYNESSVLLYNDDRIGGIEFWGTVSGKLLQEWGFDEDAEVEKPFDVTVVMAGRYVIGVRVNPDPLGRKPYNKACFENIAGSFWGNGVPDLIKDCNDICNAAARSLVANMGISSGPQVGVDVNSIPPNQDVTNVFPWKIWQLDFSKSGSSSRPPISFYQPNPMTESLLKVFEQFSRLADEYSGIPSYTYGGQQHQGGAASTASGLSMLMNAASKAIKAVVKNIDKGIISPCIEKIYTFNMIFTQDSSIKGDAQVVARGALSLVAKEQTQMRLQELLAQTANPLDMEIVGLDGRAKLWRHALSGLNINGDTIIPDDEKMQIKLAQMQQAQMQQEQMGGQPNAGSPEQ